MAAGSEKQTRPERVIASSWHCARQAQGRLLQTHKVPPAGVPKHLFGTLASKCKYIEIVACSNEYELTITDHRAAGFPVAVQRSSETALDHLVTLTKNEKGQLWRG